MPRILKMAFSPAWMGWLSPAHALDDGLDVGFRERVGRVDPVQHVEPVETGADHDDLVAPSFSRMAAVMGPTWPDGSSTTADPVQQHRVGMVTAVVL